MIKPVCGCMVVTRPGGRRARRSAGFTLIEMLIVITIIGILAALAFPASKLVIDMANGIKCSNNLRQLAMGIGIYAAQNDEKSPLRLMDLTAAGYGKKSFLCPFDKFKGVGPDSLWMGRSRSWDRYDRLYESGMSYMYEFSSETREIALPGGGTERKFNTGDSDYFYRNLSVTDRNALSDERRNWADGKRNQQALGNLSRTPGASLVPEDFGAPFATSEVPIIRCYHHFDWGLRLSNGNGNPRWYQKKVNNIFLDLSIGTSSSYWEIQANPLIPP